MGRLWTQKDFAKIYAERASLPIAHVEPFVEDIFHLLKETLYYDMQPGDKIQIRGLMTIELRKNNYTGRPGSFKHAVTKQTIVKERANYRPHVSVSRKIKRFIAKKFKEDNGT